MFVSSDSDDTTVVRTALDIDLRNEGPDQRVGVRVERAWYEPQGGRTRTRERVFLQAADIAGDWRWSARVGTDGHTIIGSASIHDDAKFRKEFFVERDVVETRQGLDRGIYSTFAGAALDLPADERNVLAVVAGAQHFTGGNVRLHLRGNFVHVVKPAWGLSLQLRTRYSHDSDPRQFDYYSPRWYAQVLPVVQLRRFVDRWEVVAAAGLGAQRDAATSWRQSQFAQLRFRSPAEASRWSAFGEFTYTNAPSNTASGNSGYRYVQTTVGVKRRF